MEERCALLVDRLHAVESATIDELAGFLQVSRMTVHRCLDRLEQQKIVRKSRGGATLLPSTVFEADYAYRSRLAVEEKAAIARSVAARVERGMAVLIDDSSTVAAVMPLLLERRPLTIITNALDVMQRYAKVDGISLMCLGGAYDPVCNACFGIVTEQSITRLRVDLALLSAAAIRGSRAYFHNPDVVRFKLACLSAAERSVLLVDHTKFSKLALHMFTHLDAFDEVATTDLLDPKDAEALRQDRVRLTLLPFGPAGAEAGKHNEKNLSGGKRGQGKEAYQRS